MSNKQNNKYHNDKVDKQLTGNDNARLHSTTRIDSSYTQASFNKEEEFPETHVTKPSLEGVLRAKDWVDNGSRT